MRPLISHTSVSDFMEAERYSLVRTIATGGMGQVYEAIARGHGGFTRRVAIKRVLPELLGDDGAKQLFRDEARIASYLHHSNIVQVLDYGVVDGTEFLVLEYVDGIDAHRLVRTRGPLPHALALHVIGQLAEALAYAHDRTDEEGRPLGIVHRDVSAQNVLLSWDGDVKLSDFGIALADTRDARTKTGMVKGKVGYMSPEQLVGRRATPAADVYALGITLQVLASGMGPGDATEHELQALPAELRELIASCTHDVPSRRLTAAEVAVEAQRQSVGTGRSALRTYLALARGATSTPRSALDDLMGLALVPAGPGQFTISKQVEVITTSAPDPLGHAGPRAASIANEPSTGPSTLLPPRHPRTLRWPLGVLAVAALGGGLVLLQRRAGDPAAAPASTLPSPVTTPAPRPPPPVTMPVRAETAPESTSSVPSEVPISHGPEPVLADPPATPARTSGTRSTERTRRRPPAPAPSPPTITTHRPPPPPSDPVEPPPMGCLRVRGTPPGWNGARILITPAVQQKKSMRAPDYTKLPAGTYQVKLVGDAGTVLDKTVVIPAGSSCVDL